MDPEVIEWLSVHFLPFEADLRRMLRRVCAGPAEVDDVVQETYCKILDLGSVSHILEPRAFLTRTAKNIVTDRLRRDAIVSIEAMASLEELEVEDGAPNPERVALARAELQWVFKLIAHLPERCRKVLRARRVNGLSQKETAESLGITVGLVEYETTRAMDLMSQMIRQAGVNGAEVRATVKRKKSAVKNDANY